ncbi:MAG: hypothetical protein IJI45_17360 [Anaerolineaceae bacterium]|nr:hypothetical protein [Anaerolineaceae bacterium]
MNLAGFAAAGGFGALGTAVSHGGGDSGGGGYQNPGYTGAAGSKASPSASSPSVNPSGIPSGSSVSGSEKTAGTAPSTREGRTTGQPNLFSTFLDRCTLPILYSNSP